MSSDKEIIRQFFSLSLPLSLSHFLILSHFFFNNYYYYKKTINSYKTHTHTHTRTKPISLAFFLLNSLSLSCYLFPLLLFTICLSFLVPSSSVSSCTLFPKFFFHYILPHSHFLGGDENVTSRSTFSWYKTPIVGIRLMRLLRNYTHTP